MSLMTPEQVAEALQVTVNRLAEMRQDGDGPDYVKLGHRTVRYRQTDVDDYVMANLVEFDSNVDSHTHRVRVGKGT